jgi:hypothetical protein
MSNEITVHNRIIEMADALEKGKTGKELKEEFTKKWNVGERQVERYIALAKDEVMERFGNEQEYMFHIREGILEDDMLWLKSNMDIERKLHEIMDGTRKEVKIVNDPITGPQKIEVPASNRDVITCANIIWRKRGVYRNPRSHHESPYKTKWRGLTEQIKDELPAEVPHERTECKGLSLEEKENLKEDLVREMDNEVKEDKMPVLINSGTEKSVENTHDERKVRFERNKERYPGLTEEMNIEIEREMRYERKQDNFMIKHKIWEGIMGVKKDGSIAE